jgi:hypothetical protein
MSALPVTVLAVERAPGGLWRVEVAYSDLSTRWFLVPETLATVEGVRISALALATLAERAARLDFPHHRHPRWAPR